MEDFVIPELPVYRPFYPLTHNSASGRKTARCVPVALKPRLMHQYHALFPSIRFPAGHNTIYLDAQVDRPPHKPQNILKPDYGPSAPPSPLNPMRIA